MYANICQLLDWNHFGMIIDRCVLLPIDIVSYDHMIDIYMERYLIDAKLTHWGRMTHIYVSKLAIIGSNNGLLPDRRQAIIWTKAGILLIENLETNFSGIVIENHTFSFKKMHFKMSSRKWRPFWLGLNVLNMHIMQFVRCSKVVLSMRNEWRKIQCIQPFPFNSLLPSDNIIKWSSSSWVQVMACCLMAPSHCLKQCWLISERLKYTAH